MSVNFNVLFVIILSINVNNCTAQNKRDVNAAIELYTGSYISMNNLHYRYFNYGSGSSLQLPVKGGFTNDGLNLGVTKNICLYRNLILSPSIGFTLIPNCNFDLIDTNAVKTLRFTPLILNLKYQFRKSEDFRQYIIAGTGISNLHIKLLGCYTEDGGTNLNVGYNIIAVKYRIGMGIGLTRQVNRIEQVISRDNERYYFNYSVGRSFILLSIIKIF